MAKRGGTAAELTISVLKQDVLKKMKDCTPDEIRQYTKAYRDLCLAEFDEIRTFSELTYIEERRSATKNAGVAGTTTTTTLGHYWNPSSLF